MNSWPLIACFGLGFVSVMLLTPVVIRWRARHARAGKSFHHTHKTPISRLGGIALAVAFSLVAAVILIWFPADPERTRTRLIVIGSSLVMFLLGLADDLRPLGAKKKLLGQILIAAAVCYFGVQIEQFKNPLTQEVYELGAWGYLLTIGWLVALTNIINLIDGIDGLAAGIALMLMALLAYVGFGGGLTFPVLMAGGMFGALLAFLRFNFPPARIYMGDGGAYFLGFLIAILTLVHSQKGTIVAALVAPLFALALPIVDVSLAILRRGLKGLPIFRPDRKHLHHRLQDIGLSRTRAVLVLYGLSAIFLLLAFGVFWSQGRWVPILFGFMCLILVFSARSFNFSRDWFAVGRVLENSLEIRKETHYALALSRWLELEAERAESPDSLWSDYVFALGKMRFTSVRLTTPEGARSWAAPGIVTHQLARAHELQFEEVVRLEFGGNGDLTSPRVFEHLSELAAEAWLKAANRWSATHGQPLRFSSAPPPLADPPSGQVSRVPV